MANWASNGGGSSGGSSSSSWVTKTSNYTAAAGDNIFADTSGGVFTITLPASPAANDTVRIADVKHVFHLNALIISSNGSKISGMSKNVSLSVSGSDMLFTYVDSTLGWSAQGYGSIAVDTIWDSKKGFPGCVIVGEDRKVISTTGSGGYTTIKSTETRSSGKWYFEYKSTGNAGVYSQWIGVIDEAGTLDHYIGYSTGGVAQSANGDVWYGNGNVGNSAIAVGDIVGVAVDFAGGAVYFYKNNIANGSKTGITLSSPLYIGASQSAGGAGGVLRTRAAECTYSPPAGYSYWDS